MSYPQDISFAYVCGAGGDPLHPLKEKGKIMQKEKYFVLGFRRYKTHEEFKNKIVGHNHRTRHYLKSHMNINWSKTHKNIILTDLQFKSLNELLDFAKQNLKKGKRQLKKGAAWGFEFIVDCTPREDWTEEDYIRYLRDAEKWLRDRFKGLKVISSVIHLDEGKPHLHITFSYFNELEGQWYQRKLKEKKLDRLKEILKEFEKDIGKKYGFVRGKGEEIDKPIKKALTKAVEEVKVKKGLFRTEKKKVLDINKTIKAIRKLSNKHKKALYENEHLREQLIRVKKEKEELENRIRKLEELARENEKLREENFLLNKRVTELERENKELKEKNIILIDSYKKALEIAAQERQLRLSKQVNSKMIERTIEKIKEDYNLTF